MKDSVVSNIPRYHLLPQGNIGELITVLQSMRSRKMIESSSCIRAWDPDCEEYVSITGLLIHPSGVIEIQTDKD